MSKTGPRPKPPELKIYEGGRDNQTIPNNPQPEPSIPSCPNWLGREAKREWKRIKTHLLKLGLLTQIDRSALAAYCQAYDRWYKAERALTKASSLTFKMPSGYIGVRPEVSISQKAMSQMIALCKEFGMTPSSRGQITLPEGGENTLNDLLK